MDIGLGPLVECLVLGYGIKIAAARASANSVSDADPGPVIPGR